MLEPNGPLPPEIYWRRRAAAIGALVIALALVVWGAFALLKGGGDSKPDAKAATSSSATSGGKPPSGTSGAPDPSSAKPSGATSSGAAPAGAQGQCPDQSLAVKVTVGQPTYKTGEQPQFGIVITNISSAACERDMGSGLQLVQVQSLDGQRKLWSSTDCYPDGTPTCALWPPASRPLSPSPGPGPRPSPAAPATGSRFRRAPTPLWPSSVRSVARRNRSISPESSPRAIREFR